MRHKYLLIFACAALFFTLSAGSGEAQRRHRGGHPIIVRSPLLFGAYYSPYYTRLGQWYPFPYPVFGFPPPPGLYPGDHLSTLRFQVPQREAIVYVDGYAAGRVDDYDGVFQRLQVVPGHHEIAVYLQGHRTFRQNLYLNPRSTQTIRHTLEPLGPGEAEEPPPVPRAMPPAPGFPAPGMPGAEAARLGVLSMRVQPGDATVHIDGEPWRGPQGQDRLVVQLPEGSHRVRVEKPGYQSFSVDIDVRAGETTSFNVSLVQ